jgi:glycosyltransferase involved in cell wall biosynthesis
LVGSASHHEDWKLINGPMHQICSEFDVNFLVAGYVPDYLQDIVTEPVPWTNVSSYLQTVSRIDVGMCPLLKNDFNKRKTPLKAMEYAQAGAAVVASPTLYRDIVAGRGTIARTEAEWYTAIKAYVTDAALRQRHAKALQNYVNAKHRVQDHAKDLAKVYKTILTNS